MLKAVFYSKNTGRVRWILSPDSDEELEKVESKNSGEAFAVLDMPITTPIEEIQSKINEITGKVPENDRYCVVDQDGAIQNVVIADPEGCGDFVEGYQLIASSEADYGWTYNYQTQQFIRPE